MANSRPIATTTVLLVRHGLTPTTGLVLPGRAPGLHLSEAGLDQARVTASRIAALGRVSAVYSSPLERTRQTAAPIAKACGLRVRRDSGLTECDFGSWTGRKLSELRKLSVWQTVQRHPSGFAFPGGESFTSMSARIVETIRRLCAEHLGDTIVVVSHADPIKAAIASSVGTPLDLFQRIVVAPCSVTAISYTATGPILLGVNSTGDDLATLVRY